MIVFGTKPTIESDDTLRWAILVGYLFFVNIINLKLLVSIIGETFAKQQISRVATGYQVKTNYLLELALLHKDVQKLNCCKKKQQMDDDKHFHFFYHTDT